MYVCAGWSLFSLLKESHSWSVLRWDKCENQILELISIFASVEMIWLTHTTHTLIQTDTSHLQRIELGFIMEYIAENHIQTCFHSPKVFILIHDSICVSCWCKIQISFNITYIFYTLNMGILHMYIYINRKTFTLHSFLFRI